MLQYSYNNIIVVTNIIMLEFLSVQFLHSGPLQLTLIYLFSTEIKHENNGNQ